MNRSLLYLLSAGALACAALPLRAEPTDDEKKALKSAEQSYKDGAFDLTSDRIASLLKRYPKSELAARAEVLQAQALYQMGRSDAAVAAFTLAPDLVPAEQRADTLFWQAEALLDLNKWPDAEQKYRALLALPDGTDHADDANLGLAWSLYKQGREADALPLLQTLIKDKGGSFAGERAQLILAKINIAKKQYKETIVALETLLALSPEKAVAYEAEYWLGETYAANLQPAQAVVAYEKITQDPQAFPKRTVALAFLGLGRAQAALLQNEPAMLAYEQTYRLTENESTQHDAFNAYLEAARVSGQLPEAVAKLQEFAKASLVSAPGALFAIAFVLGEDHQDDKAIGILESLLVAYPTSLLVPDANEQLGELYARTGKVDLATKALQNCIAANSNPALVRIARSQLAAVLLNQKHDYVGAAAQFAQISDGTDSAAESASFYFLLAQASLGKLDAFTKARTDFEKRFPQSSYLKMIAKAEGQLLATPDKNGTARTDDAKAAYQKGIALPGNGPDQEALLNALCDLQYQTGDLDATLTTCAMIAKQFPTDALLAAQRGVLVSYEMKKLNEDQVEQALVSLAQKYNNAPGAPEAYFRLGEFYFNHEDYVRAQDAFQQLITNYPASIYADNATFFAGRAAFAHQDFVAARALLEKVPDASPLKPDARLWEGRVYQQQHNFDQANTQYDAVLATEKTGPRFVEASLLKGVTLTAQGNPQDTGPYIAAMNSFDAILKSNEGTIADRNEAAVREAKCLELLSRTDDAMKLYLDVLYGREAGDDATLPLPPEFSWQIEAGWQAGRIREAQKDWRGAIEVYKRMEQIGGAHAQDFHELVNKLRRDNYIYE